MIKNKYAAYGLFVILFLVFWNILDGLYTSLITGNSYAFGAGRDLITPLALAAVSGYLLFLR